MAQSFSGRYSLPQEVTQKNQQNLILLVLPPWHALGLAWSLSTLSLDDRTPFKSCTQPRCNALNKGCATPYNNYRKPWKRPLLQRQPHSERDPQRARKPPPRPRSSRVAFDGADGSSQIQAQQRLLFGLER